MAATGSYLILIPFGSYFEGQFAVLDAATATKYAADIVPVGGVTSTAAPVSTAGTTASGTGTGTTTTAGSTVTVATVGSSVVITSTAADGSSTTGTVASISAAQTALLMNLQGILNSSNQVTATVIGDVSGATVGGVSETSIAASVTSHGASLSAIGLTLTSHGNSLSTLGTQTSSLSSQVGTLATMVNNSSTGTIQAQVSSIGTTVSSLAGSLSTFGTTVAAASTSATNAVSTAGFASALATSASSSVSTLGSTVASHSTSLSTLGTLVAKAAPITGSNIVSTSSTGTLNYAITSTVGSTTSTLTTLAIPPGTLGSGAIDGNTSTRTGAMSRTVAQRNARTYYLDDFGSSEPGFTGATGYDDAAFSAMAAQILTDAGKCTDTLGGFTADIRLSTRRHNWNAATGPSIIVPANSGGTGSSLAVNLNMRVDLNMSTHYFGQTQGFLFQPYTIAGKVEIVGRAKMYAACSTGYTLYGVKYSATAGVGYTAFFASGAAGVSNFRCCRIETFDAGANTPATGSNIGKNAFLNAIDVGGMIVGQIDGPHATSGASDASGPTKSNCPTGSSGLIVRGFNVQVWQTNNLSNYIQAGTRLVGYMESYQGTNLGGSVCDYNLLVDIPNMDWTSFYTGDSSPGLAWVIDGFSQLDANIACLDVSRVNFISIKGGYYWQHASNNLAANGIAGGAGDLAANGALIFRGCTEISVFHANGLDGPARNAASDGDTNGNTATQGGKGIWITASTYSGLSGKPNGPADSTQNSQHGAIDSNMFRGWSNNAAHPPLVIDANCFGFKGLGNAWYPNPYQGDQPVNASLWSGDSRNVFQNFRGNGTALTTIFEGGGTTTTTTTTSGVNTAQSYFYGTVAPGTAIPTGASTLAFVAVDDANGNWNGTTHAYLPPGAGTYHFFANVPLTDTGSGQPVTGTRVGIEVSTTSPSASSDEWEVVNPSSTAVIFDDFIRVTGTPVPLYVNFYLDGSTADAVKATSVGAKLIVTRVA